MPIRHNGPLVLGVDGGSTKTACVALNAEIDIPDDPAQLVAIPILGQGDAAASNWNSVGLETARANLAAAIHAAVAAAERRSTMSRPSASV